MNLPRFAAAIVVVACSRSVPPSSPNEESPLPKAAAALAEDPPLDGGSWPGLAVPLPAGEHHHHAN